MRTRELRALIDAGAIKVVHLIGDGGSVYAEFHTRTGKAVALTDKGQVKTWQTLDAAAKWLRGLGIGKARLEISQWLPDQRVLRL
ncbi:MAG: hypothetical protein ABFS23_00670 [Pseudomonadota bacterium]